MHVDNNMIVHMQDYLTPVLAASIEALFSLLEFVKEAIRKSPLTIDNKKHTY